MGHFGELNDDGEDDGIPSGYGCLVTKVQGIVGPGKMWNWARLQQTCLGWCHGLCQLQIMQAFKVPGVLIQRGPLETFSENLLG